MKINFQEFLAYFLVFVVLVGLPWACWEYHYYNKTHNHSPDAQIIEIRASAKEGEWITEIVAGWNYWWKDFKNAEYIHVQKGRPVVLRVTSTDVLHSFAIPSIPEFRKPVDIKPGMWRTFEFVPEEADTLTYLCWQYCSDNHEDMHGNIVVVEGPK